MNDVQRASGASTRSTAIPGETDGRDRAAAVVARACAEWERRAADVLDGCSPSLRVASACAFEALAASVRTASCSVCERGCEGLHIGVEPADVLELTHRLQLLTVELLDGEDPAILATALSQIRQCQALLVHSIQVAPHSDHAAAPGDPAAHLLGSSAPMAEVRRQIAVAAHGQGSVFLVGESGTGKELAARTLHETSMSSEQRLVVVNCATLPRELVESELFGYRKGAYTGAQRSYDGLVRTAHGGTLFLDEITEMTADGQAKLLRVLEEGTVRPVGSPVEIRVDVRFVASTNRDPCAAVRSGILREDIYHRLNVHQIVMPPLRDHAEDIPELIEYFCTTLAERGIASPRQFGDRALAAMMAYDWPGNVRGLRNAVVYALSAARGDSIELEDLPAAVRRGTGIASVATTDRRDQPGARIPTFAESERALVSRALAATDGNKRRAAQVLGISRHRLYDKIRKYDLAT